LCTGDSWKKLAVKSRQKIIEDAGYETINGSPAHRLVYRRVYGEFPAQWVVHHIDKNKLNNEPLNLIAIPECLHALIQ
jgi:hypothetical protein